MKTFFLKEETAKAEFALLKEIYEEYIKAPWEILECNIITPSGVFENHGGFNGTPGDLWLFKKGTLGRQKKTFWRTGFGSKKAGFKVFAYDIRYTTVTSHNIKKIASEIGAKIINDNYFTQ